MAKTIFTDEHQKFCKTLRDMRRSAGLTQQALAELLGVPQSFVSKYETGERRLDFLETRQVCLAFGQTILELDRRLNPHQGTAKPRRQKSAGKGNHGPQH